MAESARHRPETLPGGRPVPSTPYIRAATVPRRIAVSVAALALLAPCVQLSTARSAAAEDVDCAAVPWMDRSKTPETRARALLNASTLDQKLRWLDEHSANEPTRTTFTTARPREVPPGQFTPITFTMPVQVPCTPTIQYTDAPSAIAGAGAGVTAYPANVSLSSSWDTALAFDKGGRSGTRLGANSATYCWGPASPAAATRAAAVRRSTSVRIRCWPV
jgi:beta-glucosidase